MKSRLLKNSSVVFGAIVFSLIAMAAMAAEKKHWFVVQDKEKACKVIEVETVPEPLKTIAGPLKTKDEAKKIQAKECPKGVGPVSQQLRFHEEQTELQRSQQQVKENPQQEKDLKQRQAAPQQLQASEQKQQLEKVKAPAQEKIEGSKPTEETAKVKAQEITESAKSSPVEKVKEKTKEIDPSDKKD